jgi:dTDP-4-dehydrorhamnose reductase
MKKVLVLGHTGKMGHAIMNAFKEKYTLVGFNSKDFDAKDFNQVREVIEEHKPNIVINCIAKLGMTITEKDPVNSFILNTLYPRELALLSNEFNFLLIHFSTDAIVENSDTYITESSKQNLINIYGFTKHGADCFIKCISKRYYIIRISLLFGEVTKPFGENIQYVEGIFDRIQRGEKKFQITDEMIFSPTYSLDVARKIKWIIEQNLEYGLYIVANEGCVTLYDFTVYLFNQLYKDLIFERVSSNQVYEVSNRNIRHPMKSEKIGNMRDWKEAVDEYCNNMKGSL